MSPLNRRNLLGAAALSVPLAAAPAWATPASALAAPKKSGLALPGDDGHKYELQKNNCVGFHIADFVAWNNRKWDMQAYYHASNVVVEMYGQRTTTVEEHIAAMQQILVQYPDARILQHYPVITEGAWTAVIGHYVPVEMNVSIATIGRWARGQLVEELLFTRKLADGEPDPNAGAPIYASITSPDSHLLQVAADVRPGWSCVVRGLHPTTRSVTFTRIDNGTIAEQYTYAAI
jgi:hypothetical protein